jgi:dimethylaniline monooxygenase (N-oxide forming)
MSCPKKHHAIIGGGSSSLTLMKELKEKGHTFECFERYPTVGGVYVTAYKDTMLTTSSLLTAWSSHSDGKEDNPKFWTAEEYLLYLNSFAKKHDLFRHISFRTLITEIRKCPSSGKWLVTGIGGRAVQNLERVTQDMPEDPNAKPFTREFDVVCICTGTNTFPMMPEFKGQERFKGELVHTELYRNPDRFAGKRVLIVGAGESGSDICNEVSKVASKVAIAIRGKHGHLIPRIQGSGRVTDLNTNRTRYSNPYVFGDAIGYWNQILKRTLSYFGPPSDMKRVLQKIAELNIQQGTSAFSKFGCKNEGFVTAIVLRGAELHRDNFELHENKAVFEDGTEFECDAIIACTGYKNMFPFFEKYHPELVTAGRTPRGNFMQIFNIDYPGEVVFFGFARPAFGGIPPTVEMQTRYFSLVTNGDRQLPSKEEMRRIAAADKLEWETRFSYDSKRVLALVDFQVYCDKLAARIGCLPPLKKLFFTNFNVWLHIMLGPFTMHQYRLVGPDADPKRAQAVLCRQPLGDWIESSVTITFLALSKFLYTLGFKRYKPNNF